MKQIKKWGVCIAVILLSVCVVLIGKYYLSHIDPALTLYKAFCGTANSLFGSIKAGTDSLLNEKSYTIEIKRISSGDEEKLLSFSNNVQGKQMCLVCHGNNSEFCLENEQIVLTIKGDTPRSYTASLNNFRSNWNNSVFSYYVKIPQFVPENINYDTVNNKLNFKKLSVLVPGIFLNITGNDIENIYSGLETEYRGSLNICNKEYKHYAVSVPKSALVKLLKSVNTSYTLKGKLNSAITAVNLCDDKTICADILCKDNKIYSIEMSLKKENSVCNFFMHCGDNAVSLELNELYGDKTKEVLKLLLNKSKGSLSLDFFCKGKPHTEYKLYTENKDKSVNLVCIKHDSYNKKAYALSFLPNINMPNISCDGKDIYHISLSDLYHIYRHFPIFFSANHY